ncbi:LysR substrate-binding domain-containing protein [Alicyclobacillus macrosporangiidus]|uniref:LysR substrate-binding domain-containing protein n=1 Tax=Alicyclobacillus macrosporangiidus TaxID=392015 RepID=UPI00055780D1|nr:LysR substrate-binding domain-containing protein [Alicyclobacillus macrosporangiidus]
MDINAFKVFRTVAVEGSVTKAARRLSYVQSNVTARIQQLEKELGVPLFYREHRKMTLTPAGQTLLPYANQLLRILDEAKTAVLDSSVPHGPLSIGAMESTAAVRLPEIIAQYHQLHPQVELQVLTAPTEVLIEAVFEREIEGAFVDGPVHHPDLVDELTFEERLVLVTSPSDDRLEDVLSEPLLMPFKRCVYLERWQRWLKEQGHRPARVMEFGTLDGIFGCIENGFGVTVVPYSVIAAVANQRRVRCFPIPDPHGVVPTVFMRRRDLYVTTALRTFIDFARSLLSKVSQR